MSFGIHPPQYIKTKKHSLLQLCLQTLHITNILFTISLLQMFHYYLSHILPYQVIHEKNNNHTYQTFNIKNTFIKTHILDEPKTYTKLNIILPTFSLPSADKYCISLSENFPSYISNLHHININTTTIQSTSKVITSEKPTKTKSIKNYIY